MKRYHSYGTLATLVFALLGQALLGLAQTHFVAAENSRLWIEGRSNINKFECGASAYNLDARLRQTAAKNRSAISNDQVSLEVRIPVDGFRCGNTRMDRDLKKALQVERFPTIHFAFLGAEPVGSSAAAGDARLLRVHGNLTIAGVTRRIELTVNGHRLADGRVRARGNTLVLMTDYSLKPPHRFFGLVRVKDQLAVHFDLLLHPQRSAAE
tara:strand:- start:496 stop:1128 length:633 start_codon:yes stop_codon:yes gene_type:complete